jgi:hypothetical protein
MILARWFLPLLGCTVRFDDRASQLWGRLRHLIYAHLFTAIRCLPPCRLCCHAAHTSIPHGLAGKLLSAFFCGLLALVLDFIALRAYASLNLPDGGGRDDYAGQQPAVDAAPDPPHRAGTRFSAPSLPGGSSTGYSAPPPRWCARCPWGWDDAARDGSRRPRPRTHRCRPAYDGTQEARGSTRGADPSGCGHRRRRPAPAASVARRQSSGSGSATACASAPPTRRSPASRLGVARGVGGSAGGVRSSFERTANGVAADLERTSHRALGEPLAPQAGNLLRRLGGDPAILRTGREARAADLAPEPLRARAVRPEARHRLCFLTVGAAIDMRHHVSNLRHQC